MSYKHHRITSIREFNTLQEKHGDPFLEFQIRAMAIIEKIPPGGSRKIDDMVRNESRIPYLIKVACYFMIKKNTMRDRWWFNEDYTAISHEIYPENPKPLSYWNR